MRNKIVAEIGCNHCGKFSLAKKMVEEAKKCGVDAVKFQLFNSELLISRYAEKAEYQKKTTNKNESQLEMTKKLELSQDDYLKIIEYAQSLDLEVIVTPFDLESVAFLEKIGLKIWKIPSGEITNLPYLERIGEIEIDGKQIILSTGMSSIDEIKKAIEILNKTRENDITILHCNTEYPTPDIDVNISALEDIKNNFPGFKIGFSDHSIGSIASTMAVVYETSLIEKHFTLDKDLEGPDHKASATPKELKELVENVRRAEFMFGNKKKRVTESEKQNIGIARKSIVAKEKIKKGDIFTCENIICKRPGIGISPMKWYDVLGNAASRNYLEDELIEEKI